MPVMTGPVRYLFLRMARGREEIDNWPPTIKPLELPNNTVCTSVRLYPSPLGWKAENGDTAASPDGATEPPLIVTRATVINFLQGGKRSKGEVDVLGVRVVNLEAQGTEYASHFVVAALPGAGLGPRRPVVVPIDSLVLEDYVEYGTQAAVSLALRLSPDEYAAKPRYMADPLILRQAKRTLDQSILSQRARHGMTLEVEAGRIAMHGRAELTSFGDQATDALMGSPGVVDVADHLLYDEQLTDLVSTALAAKGFDTINVLNEHGIISLRGEAPDSASRYRAEDIAKRTPGVRNVVNDIVITGPDQEAAPSAAPAKGDAAASAKTPAETAKSV